jgi:hypothetical protein
MSYLNALASSGLTVGLRLSSANQTRRVTASEAVPTAADNLAPDKLVPVSQAAQSEAGRIGRSALVPLSPEERAAGRAEARAQLEAEGVLGRLGLSSTEPEAAASEAAPAESTPGQATPGQAMEEAAGAQPAEAGKDSGPAEGPLKKLTPEEEAQVRKLAQRDQEVRTHEQAHVAASGGLAGTPSYEYQTGPDGRRYAVGGEVSIRRGGSSNTEQALREAESVKRGALAPAQPSGQDMAVAARAEADIQRLRAKKSEEAREGQEGQENREDGSAPSPGINASEPAASPGAAVTPEKAPANGAGFGVQVAGAYAAAKLGSAVRPLLAKV